MKTYTVRDGAFRRIEFDGELLAKQKTRRYGAPRWTEYELYKTDRGFYVLQKVGASVVVHAPDCPDIVYDLPRFQELHPGDDPSSGEYWMCETCQDRHELLTLLAETDHYEATVTDDPSDIIEALYNRKGGAVTLNKSAVRLLDEAAAKDERLRDAYSRQRI